MTKHNTATDAIKTYTIPAVGRQGLVHGLLMTKLRMMDYQLAAKYRFWYHNVLMLWFYHIVGAKDLCAFCTCSTNMRITRIWTPSRR